MAKFSKHAYSPNLFCASAGGVRKTTGEIVKEHLAEAGGMTGDLEFQPASESNKKTLSGQ